MPKQNCDNIPITQVEWRKRGFLSMEGQRHSIPGAVDIQIYDKIFVMRYTMYTQTIRSWPKFCAKLTTTSVPSGKYCVHINSVADVFWSEKPMC